MIQPNAAMHTVPPKAPQPYFYAGERRTQFANRPTSLMVHIQGHGPRRIYRGDFNNRYFYILGSRRIFVNVETILELAR